ncbi:MAG: class I SAM-dependent methyltransferase [Coriobacteriia bacterium]|nr:class I SAM-dependent methyltransferase [Coriobacteriia bacterium]
MSGGSTDVFKQYASFYDAIYATKDYEAEAAFVHSVLQDRGVKPGSSVLDLGCGTGGHAVPLARRGYRVTGVDRSAEMIERARKKVAEASVEVDLEVGDIREVRLRRRFDAAIAMFAVMSYQCTNADLAAALATVRAHLDVGGIFLFDAWFGPAVLAQRPERRRLTATAPDGDRIERLAEPRLDVVNQTVEVRYSITRFRDGKRLETAHESHLVRFLFAQEIAYFLEQSGFRMAAIGPFMDLSRLPDERDWNVSILAAAV